MITDTPQTWADMARELQAANARLREELELIRAALTGDDYASLPSDLPTVRMAHTIRADHDKFRNQVRDTCHRAEQTEKELAEAKREYQDACKLVAQMHHAAIGSIQGPIRGVVEDVADVVETHRMQIAAISTACLMNSRNSEPPITKEHPYWSPAYEDAVQAVGREMNQRERAEQAEARALEYKTEHAALLGTSQWQETEIADLRDDVKRLMKIASECEERALAAEKDAGRYIDKWSHSCNALCMEIDLWIKNCPHCGKPSIDAAIGAKHD